MKSMQIGGAGGWRGGWALLWLSFALVLSTPAGCGGNRKSSDSTSGAQKNSSPADAIVSGGNASGAGAGGPGGVLSVRSSSGLRKSDGTLPAAPPAGTSLADLSADVVTSGDVTVSGSVTTSGPDAVRTITSANITISGTLKGGRAGAQTQGLALRSTGDILISGSVETSGSDGAAPGSISLSAGGSIVLAPGARIAAAGAPGGAGGMIRIEKAASLKVLGMIDARGGDGASGGAGGSVRITADLVDLGWDGINARGGDGGASGGAGGTIDVSSYAGGVQASGTWDSGGGMSSGTGGKGGQVILMADSGGGDLSSDAILLSQGGSAAAGAGSASGGDGGGVNLYANFDPTNPQSPSGASGGSILLSSSSVLNTDGGASAGPAPAGAGGRLYLQIPQMHVTLDGLLTARGGQARGSGAGGYGGMVWVASDVNGNATGGEVTLLASGVVDASGGDSASGKGGDARWSTTNPWIISDTNPKAVLFDSDNVNGGGIGGFILNQGQVRARGGKGGGHGGDVEFHGLGTWDNQGTGELNPLPGNTDMKGDGVAGDGTFISD
jgi:hypothetical protein